MSVQKDTMQALMFTAIRKLELMEGAALHITFEWAF
jgi:hypothetical protein